MHARRQPGPSLPQSLREELRAEAGGASGTNRRRSTTISSRKAERKAERQSTRQRKTEFFSRSSSNATNKRSAPVEGHELENNRQFKKLKVPTSPSPAAQFVEAKPKVRNDPKRKTKQTSRIAERDGQSYLDSMLNKPQVEEDEDAYISVLEKRLGVKHPKSGRSKYKSGFEQDGLLDLLSHLDEKHDEPSVEDFHNHPASAEVSDSDASSDEISEGSHESWAGFNSSAPKDEAETEDEAGGDDAKAKTAEGNSANPSKYVPPQLRKTLHNNAEERDAKLSRLLKGHLNKLTEQNIDSILREVETVYRSYRRHDVTLTLTELIIEGISSHPVLLDSYVALHAGFVACLHKIIGVDFAACFVQNVVEKFEYYYPNPDSRTSDSMDDEPTRKECQNLLVLLTDLYNFHIIACTLMYDIIRLILEGDLTELDVELILKIAKGAGSQLRQDDPSALKDIIHIVQLKLGDSAKSSSRTRFMVETLNNLKNNRLKLGVANSHGGSESKERISKFVTNIGKKYHVHAQEPLRVSLDDLHQADSKGKWWLVGAGWAGDLLVEMQSSQPQKINGGTADLDNSLLKLARKQGMNTEVRRSIFVVLMSSEDYADACDRLAQLNLTDVQQREIIRVLLHCCGNEKVYNPYYTLIGQHLCRQSHSHRVTLQFCFWDFLRSLGETNVGGEDMAKAFRDDKYNESQDFELDRISKTRMANVASAYAWWVAKDYVPITILKTLDLVMLKKKTSIFLRSFFTNLFAYSQDTSSVPSISISDTSLSKERNTKALMATILKATRVPALAQGIIHFLSGTFQTFDTQNVELDKFIGWACDVAKESLQEVLESGDSR